jgi:TatD DNase family protein
MLETDAPYLAPVPNRGKRNEPAYVPHIAQVLAEVKGVNVEEIARATTENARRLFRLSE